MLPQSIGAASSIAGKLSLDEEKELELQLENLAKKGTNVEKSTKNDSTEKGLLSLLDGLDFDVSQAEEETVVMEGKIDTQILSTLEQSETVDVIIRLKDKVPMEDLFKSAASLSSKGDRGKMVVQALQSFTSNSQQGLLTQLGALEKEGKVSNVKQFWVFNGVAATVTKEALALIEARADVEKITLDFEVYVPEVEVEETKPRLPEWGVEKINAPDVWGTYGIEGNGVVVGIMDTGVDWQHEALRKNYRGKDGNHEFSWFDATGYGYEMPTDRNGHGTHVAGTAVGGGDGEPIGVAPGAEWIAAKIFDDGGRATASGIHEAFQWFMAPGGDPDMAPDVVNNSWGSANPYRTEFLEDVQAWVAAGIFPLFAAGNDGPGVGTVGSPASFPESFAVGATDIFDQIAGFSSRGPVNWTDENGDTTSYIRPHVTAPGVQIYSALPGGGYGLKNGTSMATPHVAGAIALLLESDPDLSIADIASLLEGTARVEEHMGEVPNNNYGAGVINVYQAVTEAKFSGEITGTLRSDDGNPIPGEIHIPSENIKITVQSDGAYSFKVREGVHEVIITSFGYHTKTDTVNISIGETLEIDWTLETAQRYSITGNVTYEDGSPVSYAYVRIEGKPINTVRTNQAGEFTITDIPEDEYTVTVTGKGIKQAKKQVTLDGNKELNFTVNTISITAAEDWHTAKNNNHRNPVTNAEVDGEQLAVSWIFETPGRNLFASPVVAEGKVVFTTDTGYVVALDQITGEELWRLRTGNNNRSTPTVVDGTVYVAGGVDSEIHAIDLETGLKKWSKRLNFPAIYEAPIYHEGVVYISSFMEKGAVATALNAETGDILWQKETGDNSFFGPAFGEDLLFVGSYDSQRLSALSIEDGEIEWSVSVDGQGFASNPVYHDGVVYAVSVNFNSGSGTLRSFDAATGEALWTATGIGNVEAGSPIIFDDLVIVGSAANPVIKAFNKDNGELVWQVNNGAPILNSGSVSSNGQLFITDASSQLKIYDVYTGEQLYSYSLNGISYSGVALTEGQVIALDETRVTSFIAAGAILGSVSDSAGEPVAGAIVSIVETGQFVTTDENGNYLLEVLPGEFTVKVESYGYKQITEQMEIVSGFTIEKDYTLENAGVGSLSVVTVAENTGEALEGVTVEIMNTPLTATTNESGEVTFEEVYEGQYELVLSLSGYEEKKILLTIEADKEVTLTEEMARIRVLVFDDYEGQIVRFLNNNGISAEEKDPSNLDEIGNYRVLYLNGAYTSDGPKPTEQEIRAIIERAAEENVSVVFADTWGPSYGSLRYLWEHIGDPIQYGSYYSANGTVFLRADVSEHPIFEGISTEGTFTTLTQGYSAWFNQYSGRHLATLGISNGGFQGSGIAYKGVTEDSAHLLLSTHAASPWVSPYENWTSSQQQILLNSLNFLLDDLSFGKVSGTITDTDGDPVEGVTIEISETGVTTTTDSSGNYELFHDEGNYEITYTKAGYSVVRVEKEFAKGSPITEDLVFIPSDSGTISGSITNKITGQEVPYAEIVIYNDEGEVIAEEVSTISGSYQITGLYEGDFTLEIALRDFVTYKNTITVGQEPIVLDIELYPEPKVALINDYNFGSIRDVLSEHGITGVNYSTVAAIMDDLPNYDVVFFNTQSLTSLSKELLEEFRAKADEHEVSVIYGDEYYSGSAINHLVEKFGDPKSRTDHRNTTSSAGYIVTEDNPIFGDAEEGDFIEILIPSRSNVTSFDGYSGYELAKISHVGSSTPHGSGIAYKPRTGNSVELLMSGHGTSSLRRITDFTEDGQMMFLRAILWAAFVEFNVIEGIVTDEDGNPLDATIDIRGDIDRTTRTNPETGMFSIGSKDGVYEIEVNAFGFETYTQTVTVDENSETLNIVMTVDDIVGSIEGKFIDEYSLDGIEGVEIHIEGHPREATTNVSGDFVIRNLMPGTYNLVAEKDGYVMQEFLVEVNAQETTIFERPMKPSPTMGIIVDAITSSDFTADEYFTSRGYIVEHLYFTDLDRIEEMDIIFVNSDYGNQYIPEEEEFIAFLKQLDRTETPVIWTGSSGPRGGIRFLIEYVGDPASEVRGSHSSTNRWMTAKLVEDHPILNEVGFDENGTFDFESHYYHGFDGYTGETIATAASHSQGELGSFVAYGGRTINSVEVLLSTMTFGYGFSQSAYFDKNREKILNNAITFALDNKEPLVGEIHGTVINNLEHEILATVTVEETGYTLNTEEDGSFFIALKDGTYTLTIESFGHHTNSFEVEVVNGEVIERSFELISENSGIIKGQVLGADTNASVEGATVQLVGTPVNTTTDEEGYYEIRVAEGNYQLRVTAPGYSPQVVPVEVVHNGEHINDFMLQVSEKIAFIGTSLSGDRVIPFLEEEGYEVEFWLNSNIVDFMDVMDEYALIIFNDRHTSNMPEAVFNQFIDLADELQLSIIFTSQYGGGPIRDLRNFYNDPQTDVQGYTANAVKFKVLEGHPIFAGYEVGDEITVLQRDGSNVQYHVFENYSGTTIADLTNQDSERIGAVVAYDFRTANSVHVLLGSLRASSYGHPNDRWTDDAKQIYINAIDWAISASLGEINGTVVDENGEPVVGATVTIEDQNLTTSTDAEGFYRLGVGLGTHEVKVQARGYETQTKTATIEELGTSVELDFELTLTDRMTVSGFVTDVDGEAIEGVVITLREESGFFEETIETNNNGYYQFDGILAGQYELLVEANGYQTVVETITVNEGEDVEVNFTLSAFNIAVIGDFKGELAQFLIDNGFPAQSRDWDVVGDVYNYELILVNSNETTEEVFLQLLAKADEYETSLIFLDTWGNGGAISLLESIQDQLTKHNQGYGEGAVHITALEDHEIFEGLENPVRVQSDGSPYATFQNYEGTVLANIIVDGEDQGATIAYEFQSKNHMHLLLSTFAVNNMTGPKRGWTEDGKQLFIQAVEWARDAEAELPSVPTWTIDEEIITNGVVELTGTSDAGTIVSIIHDGEVLATTIATEDNTFTVEIADLADGVYELSLEAENVAGTVPGETVVVVLVDTVAPELIITKPTDRFQSGSRVIEVAGEVTDENEVLLTVNNLEIDIVDGIFATNLVLDEGTHTITIVATDIAGNETIVEREVTVILAGPVINELKPDTDQYVRPGDRVEISFTSDTIGGEASFMIMLPALSTASQAGANPMEEVEPGVYKGTWIVPTDVDLKGAIIEVTLTDSVGNTTKQTVSGKLYISSEQMVRLKGDTRFGTAVKISEEGWDKADTVIIARSDDFADALAGVPLAYKLNAPILLTRSNELMDETLAEIKRLEATNIIILGGEGAISEEVVTSLEEHDLTVTRIAGSNRYETAAEIARYLAPEGTEKVVVANGLNFPDALSIASYAAREGLPILLTRDNELPEATSLALQELGAENTIVVGGKSVVSDEVLAELPGADRLSGSTRYETNIAIMNEFNLDTGHMYVASGLDFADVLTGAVLAAKRNSAVLLVRDDSIPEIVSQFISNHDIKSLTIFGGTGAVSEQVANNLFELLE